jgi:copper oxidase (laccase) domain-containing protein
LGILTADCAPILFYDPINMIVGACHAGWRGALTGIIENTLIKMESIGSKKK